MCSSCFWSHYQSNIPPRISDSVSCTKVVLALFPYGAHIAYQVGGICPSRVRSVASFALSLKVGSELSEWWNREHRHKAQCRLVINHRGDLFRSVRVRSPKLRRRCQSHLWTFFTGFAVDRFGFPVQVARILVVWQILAARPLHPFYHSACVTYHFATY